MSIFAPPPQVVVSIPHYRARGTLRRAVDSVLAQTHNKLTAVVVSDGDDDPPWDVLADIDDPRLMRFDLGGNHGRLFADAVVLLASDAPFFLAQDADDWSEPTRVEELLKRLRDDAGDAVFSSEWHYVYAEGWSRTLRSYADAMGPPRVQPVERAPWRLGLYRTSTLRELGGPYGGQVGHDRVLVNLLALAGRISYVDEPLYGYHQGDGGEDDPPDAARLDRLYWEAVAIAERHRQQHYSARTSRAMLRALCKTQASPDALAALHAHADRLRALLHGAASVPAPVPHAVSPSVRARLPQAWREWLAHNEMRGVPAEELREALRLEGFSLEDVDPASLAASKAGWLLEALRRMRRIAPRNGSVDRRTGLSAEEFRDEYYSANRPVVLCGAMDGWRALGTWTPDALKERFADEVVEITTGRDADPRFEVNLMAHRQSTRFGDYVDRVLRDGETNDHYLVANNQVLERTALRELIDDIEMFPGILNPERTRERVFFWFGPAGTVTPFHHDMVNIFMAQVFGRKDVLLAPSVSLPRLYGDVGVFSPIDPERPDPERYPLFDDVDLLRVTLHPGEVLFLPVGWWHQVRSLDVSMTVTLDNFVFDNELE